MSGNPSSDDWYFLLLQKALRTPNILRAAYDNRPQTQDIDEYTRLLSVLKQFHNGLTYLKARRGTPSIAVTSEAVVQDLLFIGLKPLFPDLTYEDPTPKGAASFAIKDLYFPSIKAIVEAKFIDDRAGVKKAETEIHDDILKYTAHPGCERLVFYVYDVGPFVADPLNFQRHLSKPLGELVHKGRSVEVLTLVRP